MKVRLLYRDRDFEWAWAMQAAATRAGRRNLTTEFESPADLPPNAKALIADLGLDTLFDEMAGDDACIYEVVRTVILCGVTGDLDTIRYRQAVLQDCIDHSDVIRALYALANEATEIESKHYLGSYMQHYPDSVLRWSTETLEDLFDVIRRMRKLADTHGHVFQSEGWSRFFATLREELNDAYLAGIKQHLKQLRFRGEVVISCRLNSGNKGKDYVVHLPPSAKGPWLVQALKDCFPSFFRPKETTYSFTLHPRDESGFKALGTLKNRGFAPAASALGQSTDHVRRFFAALRTELAFYVGCLNLHERLSRKNEPLCLPSPAPTNEGRLSFDGLYDVCLSLNVPQKVIGNDVSADGKSLIVVTGANTGGKSTFLRSLGLAQLMMQSGMFVPAKKFNASLCDGVFTHYRREEDSTMDSGKLDEELKRMSEIIDDLKSHSMILFNESFASTNEREGSEIARQFTASLPSKSIRMVFVTHLYDFANSVLETNARQALFLRAERQADGTRSFKLIEGPPLETSYGEDLYREIFGENDFPTLQAVVG